jgi:hypothetical protein
MCSIKHTRCKLGTLQGQVSWLLAARVGARVSFESLNDRQIQYKHSISTKTIPILRKERTSWVLLRP